MTKKDIIFDNFPKDIDEFKSLFNLENPHETAGLFILAIDTYVKNKDLGIEMINFLKGPEKLNQYGLQFLRDRLGDKSYLPTSYFIGSSPKNDYTPSLPLTIEIYDDPYESEEGYLRLFLQSSGADSKRPIILRKKGSQYFVWEYGGLLAGIRIPEKDDVWA